MPLPIRPHLGPQDEQKNIGLPPRPVETVNHPEPPASLPAVQLGIEDHHEDPYNYGYTPAPAHTEPTPVAQVEPTHHVVPAVDEEDEFEDELAGFSDEIVDSLERLMEEILSDSSTEVIMNGPNAIHYKSKGRRYHIPEIDFKDAKTYHTIINKFILPYTDTKDRITDDSHLIEGQLEIEDNNNPSTPPAVARVTIIAPPVVKTAKVTIAKKSRRQYSVDDLAASGSMSHQMAEFLKAISRGKLTTVISGVSGSGKTTLLEALSHHFDRDDRVIVVEDTPELRLPLADVVNMVSYKPKPGEDKNKAITLEWLVAQTNRMRPDRIIVGETRGPEMAEFLLAANSGADGSMTTLHANNPRRTLSKMAALASRSSDTQDERSINRDIASTVQIIVQTGLIDDRHVITHIEEVSNIISVNSGAIATTTLFEFDRRTEQFVTRARLGEELTGFLTDRGVTVDPAWFRKQ